MISLYSQNEQYKLYHGTMLDLLEVIAPSSIDSIVTDPPYELGFMNKGWDNSGIAFQTETWKKCYAALKSGGYLLAFGGSRTFHRIACAIEDAGFEIRDTIMWLYGSGFPKSMNIGKSVESKLVNGNANSQAFKYLDGTKEEAGGWGVNKWRVGHGARPRDYDKDKHERTVEVDYQTEEGKQWNGWGTALKPSYEPIIVARKPCEGSTTDNVLKWGVGGINIEECRIGSELIKGGTSQDFRDVGRKSKEAIGIDKLCFGQVRNAERIPCDDHIGRFPANTILTYDETDEEEVCGGMPEGGKNGSISKSYKMNNTVFGEYGCCNTFEAYDDSGSAARYYYCAKASKKDRDEGLEQFAQKIVGDGRTQLESAMVPMNRSGEPRRNIHPTVKPTELMQYLVRLVTPAGGTVLDPFNGSGSTGKAVMWENRERDKQYKYIGIELTEDYLPIARARIEYAVTAPIVSETKEVPQVQGQISLFDFFGEEE